MAGPNAAARVVSSELAVVRALVILLIGAPGMVSPALAQEAFFLLPSFATDAVLEEAADANPERLQEQLAEKASNPAQLNTAALDQLIEVPFLSPDLARAIARYRCEMGPFKRITDLLDVPGMSPQLLDRMAAYVLADSVDQSLGCRPEEGFRTPPSIGGTPMRVEMINRASNLLSTRAGAEREATFLQSVTAARLYHRIVVQAGKSFSAHLTVEKDPGEAFRWNGRAKEYGYDFYSFGLSYRGRSRVREVVVGDFDARFGQGLLLWPSGMSNRALESSSIRRAATGFVPHRSSDENRFFRGVAGSIRITENGALSGFLSFRSLDGSDYLFRTDSTRIDPRDFLVTTGYHRSTNERLGKDAINDHTAGAAFEWQRSGARIGITGYIARTGTAFSPAGAGSRPNLNRATSALSTYGDLSLGFVSLFLEAGGRAGHTPAWILGANTLVRNRLRFVGLWRSYPAGMDAPYGYPLAQQSGPPGNETGFYLGIELYAGKQWLLSGFFDQYRFGMPRYRHTLPSQGNETSLSLDFAPMPRLRFHARGRSEVKEIPGEITDRNGRRVSATVNQSRQSLRLGVEYRYRSALRFRSRIEAARIERPDFRTEKGLLFYQDVQYIPTKRLAVSGRWALFDTGSYTSRLYMLESDLTYALSLPALYGTGYRSYLLIKVWPGSRVQLEFKASVMRWNAGASASPEQTVSRECRGQVRIRL